MKKTSLLLAASALMALATACSNNDEPTPVVPEQGDFKGIIFATAVTNPEGNSGVSYVQTLDDLKAGTIDNRNAIPTGFGVMPIVVPSGNVYAFPDYMGQTKAEVTRYTVDGKGQLIKKGALSIPAAAAASNIVELNSEKAYLTLQTLGKVRVFNPTTMTLIQDIDLNALAQEGCKVSPAAMIIRDGKLFVGLNQMNANYMPQKNQVELAMIDTKTDKLEKHIVSDVHGLSFATRPIDPNSIFMDEQKDIYINCMGAFGFMPQFPGGLVRIKNGATDIDPDYCIALNQTPVAGLSVSHADCFFSVCYGGNGKLYAYGSAYALDPNAADSPYTSMTAFPVEVDLNAKSIQLLSGLEIGNPQGIAIAKHKGSIVFGSSNKKANGFYTYNPTTKKFEGEVMHVKGFPGFFHSFSK